jgi:hypothetical protein
MQEEIWKDVLGYEGIYQVSNLGRVKSFKRCKEKILKPYKDTAGYLMVDLNKNKRITLSVHRLIATTFLGISDLQVNHINGIKTDNKLENLEFVCARENSSHRNLNKNTTSKFIGVSWNKQNSKWVSNIRINGHQTYLGLFETELDAFVKADNFVDKSFLNLISS